MERVFYAHRRDADVGEINEAVATLSSHLAHRLHTAVKVTSGRDDFKRRFAMAGGWSAWPDSVSSPLAGGESRYTIIVVPDGPVGKATAQIVETALQRGVACLWWDGDVDEPMLQQLKLVQEDREDWKNGWFAHPVDN